MKIGLIDVEQYKPFKVGDTEFIVLEHLEGSNAESIL